MGFEITKNFKKKPIIQPKLKKFQTKVQKAQEHRWIQDYEQKVTNFLKTQIKW